MPVTNYFDHFRRAATSTHGTPYEGRLGGAEELGVAYLKQTGTAPAGSYGTWSLVYRAGTAGVATGGSLRIITDSDTDCGWPQLDDPTAPDYVSVEAPPNAGAVTRIASHRELAVDVLGVPIAPSEEVRVHFGDRSGGSPGFRLQTFLEAKRFFTVQVDAYGRQEWHALPECPYLSIVGEDAEGFAVTAPSDAVAGEPFSLLIKAEDRWGNPAMGYRGRVKVAASGLEIPVTEVEFDAEHNGVRVIEGCTVTESGVYRVLVRDDERDIQAQSNPVTAWEEPPEFRLYWGDPHGGQVQDPNKIPDFFDYARDVSGIHFAGFQRNDHAWSNDAYRIQQSHEVSHYEPGRFVPLPGFEWTGTIAQGGHHNVYFRRFNQPIRRSNHMHLEDLSDVDTDLTHVTELHRHYKGTDTLITPHVGGGAADLSYHDLEVEPALEVTSTHGSFEWFLRESLERRHKMGFVGGSDCYTGRPGDDRPGYQLRRYAKGGLTGLYARELTLEGIFEALRSRRCFATTGVRIRPTVNADGHVMGSEYSTSCPPRVAVDVHGVGPIETVELFRGLDLVHRYEASPGSLPSRIRILWQGASMNASYSGVIWEGVLRVKRGSLSDMHKLRFDSPRSQAAIDQGQAHWTSWTCGYRSGLSLGLDAGEDTEIEVLLSTSVIANASYGGHGDYPPNRINTAPADRLRFSASLSELVEGPKVLNLGPVDRKVTLSLDPEPGPEHVKFEVTDDEPEPGLNPYWVRIVQSDQEMAWTSPVFVDYAPDPRSV